MTPLEAQGHSGRHDSGQAVNFTVNNVLRSLKRAPNGFKCKAASEAAVNLHLFATHPECEWAKSSFLTRRGSNVIQESGEKHTFDLELGSKYWEGDPTV